MATTSVSVEYYPAERYALFGRDDDPESPEVLSIVLAGSARPFAAGKVYVLGGTLTLAHGRTRHTYTFRDLEFTMINHVFLSASQDVFWDTQRLVSITAHQLEDVIAAAPPQRAERAPAPISDETCHRVYYGIPDSLSEGGDYDSDYDRYSSDDYE